MIVRPDLKFNQKKWYAEWKVFFESQEDCRRRKEPSYMWDFLEQSGIDKRPDYTRFEGTLIARNLRDSYLKKEDREKFAEYLKKIKEEKIFSHGEYLLAKDKIAYVQSVYNFHYIHHKSVSWNFTYSEDWRSFFHNCFAKGREASFFDCKFRDSNISVEDFRNKKVGFFDLYPSEGITADMTFKNCQVTACVFENFQFWGRSNNGFSLHILDSSFGDTVFSHCAISNVCFENIEFSEPTRFRGTEFHNCVITNSRFVNCRISKELEENCVFINVVFIECSFYLDSLRTNRHTRTYNFKEKCFYTGNDKIIRETHSEFPQYRTRTIYPAGENVYYLIEFANYSGTSHETTKEIGEETPEQRQERFDKTDEMNRQKAEAYRRQEMDRVLDDPQLDFLREKYSREQMEKLIERSSGGISYDTAAQGLISMHTGKTKKTRKTRKTRKIAPKKRKNPNAAESGVLL